MKSRFTKSKEIVAKEKNELATTNLAELGLVAHDDVNKSELPRASLRLLQTNSPQCDKRNAKYVEGAEPGMIFNTSNRSMYKGEEDEKQLVILICKYWPKYIEWLPGRKGFVGEHEIGSELTLPQNLRTVEEEEKKVVYSSITNNIMAHTAIYHCLAFLEGSLEPEEVSVDMTSTNWTCAKLLNAHFTNAKVPDGKGRMVKGPTFTWAYQLFHEYRERTEKNQSWYTWNFKPLVRVDEMSDRANEYIQHALEYRKLVESGNVDFDYRQDQQDF